MVEFSQPGLFGFMVFGGMFVTAGIMQQAVFWLEIEPVLRRLGYRYNLLSLRRYPDVFLRRSLNTGDFK